MGKNGNTIVKRKIESDLYLTIILKKLYELEYFKTFFI